MCTSCVDLHSLIESKCSTMSPSLHAPQVLAGADAFLLYDTFGFPLELTQELAEQKGIQVCRVWSVGCGGRDGSKSGFRCGYGWVDY